MHSVDKVAWCFKDVPPVSAVGHGGRQIPQDGGNIYDHFSVNYLYPDNARAFIVNRQIPGCHNENADYVMGSKGVCLIGRSPKPRIEGENKWTYDGPTNDMYQAEHDAMFAAIRKNQPINNIIWMSSLCCFEQVIVHFVSP